MFCMWMDYSKRNVSRETKCTRRQAFGGESRGRETTWETGVDGEDNIKMDLQEVGCGGIG